MQTTSLRLLGSLTALTLATVLAGCGSSDGSGSAAPAMSAAPATSAAPAATPLSFDLVQQQTAPLFAKDPNCAYGEWSENSTGVDEKFRATSTFFRQFDCYKSKDDVGGLPDRLQQSLYVEFTDAAAAKAYADDQAILYKTLVDDKRVVVAGTGLPSVDMAAYLNGLEKACNCGTVTGG